MYHPSSHDGAPGLLDKVTGMFLKTHITNHAKLFVCFTLTMSRLPARPVPQLSLDLVVVQVELNNPDPRESVSSSISSATDYVEQAAPNEGCGRRRSRWRATSAICLHKAARQLQKQQWKHLWVYT